MNKEKQRIVPELRFPEFENAGNWEETILNDIADYANGKAHEKEISETGKYKVVNSKFISTDGEVVKFSDSANLKTKIGDILMVLSDVPNGKAIAKCFYVDKDETYTVNQRICRITPTDIDNRFLFYIQNRNSYFLSFDDGVKQTNLTKDDVLSFPFLKPKNPKEQQKIANCLSSLDNLIAAETDKLVHLKDHKKGLLHQLFPAKGETKPQFRFPEFENAGDWEETILDGVADYANGKAHEKEISETGKYKVVNSKFISTDGEVVKFSDSANLKTKIGDILMVLSDVPNGKAIAKCFYVDKDDTYTVNQRICRITPTDIDNKFLFYIQNRNSYFLSFDDGVKQTNLTKDNVLSFPFLKPSDPIEQEKIADCLSTADEIILEQTSRIEALKDHKKGLMQQLFPNANEH